MPIAVHQGPLRRFVRHYRHTLSWRIEWCRRQV